MTALLFATLLAAVAYLAWDNRRTRVAVARNAERAVTAAVAARGEREAAGRIAGEYAFDARGVTR